MVPADLDVLAKVQVEYQSFEGWKTSIASVTTYEALPKNCKRYVEFIEDYLGTRIEWIGVGPGRGEMISKLPR